MSSLRQFGPALVSAPEPATHPSFLGKYFIAGVAAEDDAVVTYRGVHSVVNQNVLVHLGRTPVAADGTARSLIAAGFKPLTRFHEPRIARVFDIDFQGDRPYLVTEALEDHRSLESFLATEPPTPAGAAALVAELARGLEAAHRLGLGHGSLTARCVQIDDTGRPRSTASGSPGWSSCKAGRPPGPPPRSPGLTSLPRGSCSSLSYRQPSRTVPGGPTSKRSRRGPRRVHIRMSGRLPRDLERQTRPAGWPVLWAAALLVASILVAACVWWLTSDSACIWWLVWAHPLPTGSKERSNPKALVGFAWPSSS